MDSKELCTFIAEKSNGTCLLSFSCGKDAIVSWLRLKDYFHTIIPVYRYLVPGLSFIEKSLGYYEDFFQTKIIQVPNPNLFRMLNAGTYQTPGTWQIFKEYNMPNLYYTELNNFVKNDHGLPESTYTAIGNRMYDNLMRYRSITKYGPYNEKTKEFYPVFDYKIADVVNALRTAEVSMPIDYRIWGKTFDGIDYRFLKPLKEKFPADYQKIKDFFPLIDIEIMRYEQIY